MQLFTLLTTSAFCLGFAAAHARGAEIFSEILSAGNLVSRTGVGHSLNPSFSGDGRFVTFVSQAQNLATNGSPSRFLNVYVRDLESDVTTLVSVSSSGRGGGNEDSNFPTISSNGQFIAFSSRANNLVPGDTNGVSDVFVRDLASQTTSLVSATINGAYSRSPSVSPVISADGRRIVFQSTATDLVTNSFPQGGSHLFVRDLSSDSTSLVSVGFDGLAGAFIAPYAPSSDLPSLSADGRYVAFYSNATNLVPNFTNYTGDVFIRDLDQLSTVWASIGAANILASGLAGYYASSPQLSSDGNVVIFEARYQSGNRAPMLISFNRLTGVSVAVSTNLSTTSLAKISADGRFVAYQSGEEIWLTDLNTGSSELVCGTNTIPGVATCAAADISGDGQRVVFRGAASANGPWNAYLYDRITPSRDLVSMKTNGLPASIVGKSEPVISLNGERVAFESTSAELVPNDANGATDVFVSDLITSGTRLVSEAVLPARTGSVGRGSVAQIGAVSQYGRHVAFASLNNQLTPDDDNVWQDVFVLDRIYGTNQLIRHSITANETRLAFAPALSTNGRYVAWFEQPVGTGLTTNIYWLDRETGIQRTIGFGGVTYPGTAPSLSPDGRWLAFAEQTTPGGFTNVYLRDLSNPSGSNELVSVNRQGTGGGSSHSTAPKFSPDGRWLLFLSRATDLTTNQLAFPSFPYPQLYARDLHLSRTRWMSSRIGGVLHPQYPAKAAVTASGRFVFIEAASTPNSAASSVYQFDLASTNGISTLCTSCFNPSASADGRIIAYEQRDAAFRIQIFVRDALTQETLLVSSNTAPSINESGTGNSFSPLVTADGRYVVFTSRATNLVSDDINAATDIFVHDRTLRSTFLVSRGMDGNPGTGPSTLPVLAPDGRTIVFTSFASNLAPGDFNNARDVSVVRLGGPDTDADGLDDEWEIAYFANLDKDGAADSDLDGASDGDEYRAGTNPTNDSSILRVLSTSFLLSDTTVIGWNSEIGQRYRLQYKQDLTETYWTDLPVIVTAVGTTTTMSDHPTPPRPRRFYRVVVEP